MAELRDALAKLEAKINEAEAKREIIIAKQRRAATQDAINTALRAYRVSKPTTRCSAWKIRLTNTSPHRRRRPTSPDKTWTVALPTLSASLR